MDTETESLNGEKMSMKRKLLMALFSVLLLSGAVSAQTGTDNGTPDTVRLVVSNTMMMGNDLKVTLDLWVYNDVQTLASIGVGFGWLSPNLVMDSAQFEPVANTAFDFVQFLFLGNDIAQTNAAKQFQFAGSRLLGSGLVMDPAASKHIATYWMTFTNWTINDSIVIDTASVGNTGYSFVDVVGSKSYFPVFAGTLKHFDPNDVNVIGGSDNLPKEYALDQNYPNPFNPTTTINFSLPVAGDYKLTIYNILGQVVETFEDKATRPGRITVEWDATRQATGIYFYRLESASFSDTKKMMLLK